MGHRENVYISLKAPAESPSTPNSTPAQITVEFRVFWPDLPENVETTRDMMHEAVSQAFEKFELAVQAPDPPFVRVSHHEAQAGDLAVHKTKDLDARHVAKIDLSSNEVHLHLGLGDHSIGPMPADNYRYFRYEG